MLAAAIRGRPVVLATAGVDKIAEPGSRPPGRMVPVRSVGGDPAPFLRRYDAMLRTATEIDHGAAGYGLLNADPDGGVVRQIPLLALVGGVMTPTLALEMFRVAAGAPGLTVMVVKGGIQGVGVGDFRIPTQRDGSVWLRYTGPTPARFVSATDVLAGTVAPDVFDHKLVLVGVTALGLSDRRTIAGGLALDGVEIHAELIESIFDHALLARPPWAPWAEAGFLFAAGVLLVLALSARRTRVSLPRCWGWWPWPSAAAWRSTTGASCCSTPRSRRSAWGRLHHDAEPHAGRDRATAERAAAAGRAAASGGRADRG